MTFIKNAETIEKYKTLKLEFWSYLDGLTRGGNVKDKMRNFFRHLEDMIFGEDIDINDISKL